MLVHLPYMHTVRFRCLALALGVTLTARVAAGQPAAPLTRQVTAADVQFMQDMIVHHQQAVEMTALLKTRTHRSDMMTLGARISISQADEIDLMGRWLTRHGASVPASSTHEMAGHDAEVTHAKPRMPGMLSASQMAALRNARGLDFDHLFLLGMIQHHQGALAMVKALMETPAAAQESALNRFVNDVSTDQQAEIARMRRLIPRG